MSLIAWYPLNGNFKDNCGGPTFNTNYVYGDVNKNGRIDTGDLDELFNVLSETNKDTTAIKLGDVDGDGKTSGKDSNLLTQYINGENITVNNRINQSSDIVRIQPVWVDGKTGKAFSEISPSMATNIIMNDKLKGLNRVCISCWVMVRNVAQNFGSIINFKLTQTGEPYYNDTQNKVKILRLETCKDSDDTLYLDWFANDSFTTDSGTGKIFINYNEWNHIILIMEESTISVYLNGTKATQIAIPESTYGKWYFTGEISLGNKQTEISNFFDGAICNVKIYNHVLSKKEILEDYKQPILHYTFENPYVTETTNISHNIVVHDNNIGEVTLGSDSTGKYMNKTNMTFWSGIGIKGLLVKPGRYYTWSIELMPIKDIEYVIDGNIICNNSGHGGNDIQHFDIIRGYSHMNHKLDGSDTLPKGKLEAYKWTRIYFTIKVKQDCTNPYINHTFVPYIPSGDSSVKVYYRNSQLEERMYDSPYASNGKRNLSTIKDNSGMGNNGTQVYQRIEIPIESITPTSAQNLTDTISNGTHTIKGFNGTTNQCIYFGKIKYSSLYHYVGAIVCYEFDLKVTDMTTVSGQTPKLYLQGPTALNDGTGTWYDNPIPNDDLYKRINNGKNGTYHICLQKKITLAAGVTDVASYGFGVRFDYIKSGTITISNLHAYYDDLDTSKLTIADKSVIGSHSLYLNGKNYINCGVVTPSMMDEFTASIWLYRDDWTIKPMLPLYSSFFGARDNGGFAIGPDRNIVNLHFEAYYKSIGYLHPNDIDMTKLSAGWHLITGVANKNRIALYLDGELYSENVHNKNAQISMLFNNNDSTIARMPIYVGAELDGWGVSPVLRTVKDYYMDDIRLYATALDDKDIKALYNIRTRIDNKSNLHCNQLIETKSKNMMKPLDKVDLNTIYGFNGTGTVTYLDGIIKYLATSAVPGSTNPTNNNSGMFVGNVNYGGSLLDNVKYRCEFYVRVSKQATYLLGEERLGSVRKVLESGKWYHIKQEAKATNSSRNLIVYNESKNLAKGDTIEVRDIKIYRLYNTDNYTQEITKKGQFKTFELDETPIDKLTSYKTINKYNATWLQIFHHDTNNNTVWFSDEAEALNCDSQYKFSILDQLEGFRGSDGKFEFLLEYPQDLPNQYNRWKQTDNPATTLEANNSTYGTPVNGYEAIHVDWTSKGWGGLLKSKNVNNATRTFIDGSTNHASWYYSIGCYNNHATDWKDKMPGPDGSTGMKEVNLYVRLDEKYMGATIVDKYGAEWLEIFYHDNNNCKVFFDNQTEALHTNSQYKFSILDQLEKFRGNDGKFEFLLEYPTDIPGKYNRWKQTDNPVKVLANNTYANGYEVIHVDWSDNNWGGLLRATSSSVTLLKGSIVNTSTWYFAIGAIKAWDSSVNLNGVPGPLTNSSDYSNPNGIVHDIHLYVRIDNLEDNDNFKIYNRNTKTNEIIEI